MNFHVKLDTGYAEGVLPSVKLADGWRPGEELFVLTEAGWRTVWRRQYVFINTADLSGASIFELMGSPTGKRRYVFVNRGTLYAGSSGFALRTGVFPAGSTLTIVNEGAIRGAGGNGAYPSQATPGQCALLLEFPTNLDNRAGLVFGGGGGGGYRFVVVGGGSLYSGGGGGAGRKGGARGQMYQTTVYGVIYPGAGTDAAGGAGGRYSAGYPGGAGGAPGEAGVTVTSVAGAGGYAIDRAGNVLTIIAGGETDRLKGAIV
ncbi:hypothetical protein [Pseudomonas xanthosomatis]|uniref:hypothetical protein n=1 Tax=Pseudomonas xanthosomatis TaxID=2842356 RepID=UPI0035162920